MLPAPGEKLYKIKGIAAISGFSPTLLRAWERRYSLLHPIRTETGHRLYTQTDLDLLLAVRALLRQGHTIGELVALGREHLLGLPRSRGGSDGEHTPPVGRPGTMVLGGLETSSQAIMQAALALDEPALTRALDQAWSSFSTEVVIKEILTPCAHEIGALWATGKATVAAEHLLISVFSRRMHRIMEFEARPRDAEHPAIVACLPDELHEFPCLLLNYWIARRGVPVVNFGSALPVHDLELAIAKLQPRCVLLSVSRTALLQVHLPMMHDMVSRWTAKTQFILGGAGATDSPLDRLGVMRWSAQRSLDELSETLLSSRWQD